MYTRRLEDFWDVFWTSYVCQILALCQDGHGFLPINFLIHFKYQNIQIKKIKSLTPNFLSQFPKPQYTLSRTLRGSYYFFKYNIVAW